MAGITLTVCLPDGDPGDVRSTVADALAPFDMNSADNPFERGMWTSWRISGGSDGTGFAIAEGYEHDTRLIHDDPTWEGRARPSVPGVCAGGPRGLLDFSRPSAANECFAAAVWDLWHGLLAAQPSTVSLSSFLKRREPGSGRSRMRELLSEYFEQPAIAAFLEHPWARKVMWVDDPDPKEHPVIRFKGSREEWIFRMAASRPPSTDVLTPDGWWIEADGNALHGACESQASCSHVPEISSWPGAEEYLAGLAPQSIIVRVRCTW